MEKNAQKPMAWIWQFPDGEFYETPHSTKEECERDCCGYDGMAVPTYTTQPVPRDALMAALYELSDACLELNGNGIGCDVISAIADRYSGKIQLTELEKDAGRYRWLREQHWSDSTLAVICNPTCNVLIGTYCPSKDLLDEAIDGLMENQNANN